MSDFDWKTQLAVGDRGQELFMQHYPRKLEISKDFKYDFIVKSSRETVELKTDTYNIDKTPNFFFEKYGNMRTRKYGGPWRAKNDGIDIFCYYFVRHNTWFEFRKIAELVDRLDKLIEGKNLIYIKNKGYASGGYAIPRESVRDLYSVHTFTYVPAAVSSEDIEIEPNERETDT